MGAIPHPGPAARALAKGRWGALPSDMRLERRHSRAMCPFIARGFAVRSAVSRTLPIRALGVAGLAASAAVIVLAVHAVGVELAVALALTVTIAALSIALGVICTRKVVTVSRRRARGGA